MHPPQPYIASVDHLANGGRREQPAYVLDIPGGYGKVPIAPSQIERGERGWVVEDGCGHRHLYPADPAEEAG